MLSKNNLNWQKLRTGKLDWNIFHLRSRIMKSIREFFELNDFIEVEVPILTPYPTLDSNIVSMETIIKDDSGNSHTLFLHTSPEHCMKKLISAGAEKIFFLGKVFRNQELTNLHNPEFTLLEWYRINSNYKDIQKDTQNLVCYIAKNIFSTDQINYQGSKILLNSSWEYMTIRNLFKEKVGIDLDHCQDTESLKNSLAKLNINFLPEDDWETLFFRLFIERIESDIGFSQPTFVMDYPYRMALMAQKKAGTTNWVERTELYIAGIELANGYSELIDPDELLKRFIKEQAKKKEEGYDYHIDEDLILALKSGMPSSAGIAFGVDRLIMLFTNQTHIKNVLFFPFHQWK
jgi:lysyl-tRNA synthetase class 2